MSTALSKPGLADGSQTDRICIDAQTHGCTDEDMRAQIHGCTDALGHDKAGQWPASPDTASPAACSSKAVAGC